MLDQVAEIAEELLLGLALAGQSAAGELALADGEQLGWRAVVELEHQGEAAATALLLLEVVFYLVFLTFEDYDRIGVPVGREVALPVFHHTQQTVDGCQVLRVGHQQMGIVDDDQTAPQLLDGLLVEGAYPLVVGRGIDLLDTRMGDDAVGEEQLVDETDEEGLARAAVAEYEHIHLGALAQPALALRGGIESHQALHLIDDLLLLPTASARRTAGSTAGAVVGAGAGCTAGATGTLFATEAAGAEGAPCGGVFTSGWRVPQKVQNFALSASSCWHLTHLFISLLIFS